MEVMNNVIVSTLKYIKKLNLIENYYVYKANFEGLLRV